MRLSFVLLGYKEQNLVRICIQNIIDLHLEKRGIEHEIIFVDNHGGIGLPEQIREFFGNASQIRIIENEKNLGHPAGNNRGLQEATGEYIVMLNPDIVMRDPQEITKILAYMDDHTDVAILGPKLRNPNGTVQNTCFQKYSLFTPIYRRTFLGKLPFGRKDIERHLMVDFDHNETREVEWLMGSNYVIRKAAMDQFGLMDERLFLYFGDYEWCDRAHEKAWKVVYYHDTRKMYHYHQRESASSRFAFTQVLSYTTRIHIRDWITYLHIKKEKQK